jgi:Dyp-type peroxidase family
MQRDLVVKGKSLGGTSDLTLLAKIKPGFVDVLESVTYKTRIQRVLQTLHLGRTAAHEQTLVRLLSDAVERVGAIHSVRVAVFEPQGQVMLAVTFDGSWEAYIRVLWDQVGGLLDLIFCGTEDYVLAATSSFEQWRAWAQRVQVETAFFYGPPESTARDVLYHRRTERLRLREGGSAASERDEMRTVQPGAEQMVLRALQPPHPAPADEPPLPVATPEQMPMECVRQGLRGLAGLYRLAELHPPGSDDGEVLRRAALELLRDFCRLRDAGAIDHVLRPARARFATQLDWLFPTPDAVLQARPVPPFPPAPYAIAQSLLSDLQGGILRPYKGLTHGVAVLLAFDNPAAGAALLAWLDGAEGRLTSGSAPHQPAAGEVLRNIALTAAGLRTLGLDEDTLALWPEAFRQGMAARAGLLGDLRHNHPQRWRLPLAFKAVGSPPGPEVVAMESVHAVLQLRCSVDAADAAALAALELHDIGHPLQAEVGRVAALHARLRVLAVQSLRRNYRDPAQRDTIVEHFGYADGNGQPEIEVDALPFERTRAQLGEVVLGHANAADWPVDPADPGVPAPERERARWLHNGSFLVLRKYRQNVAALRQAVEATARQMQADLGGTPATHRADVYAKLMGRQRDSGLPLQPHLPGNINHFDFDGDAQGRACPLTAHVRRANPRAPVQPAARAPWLMRRSMSYGPPPPPDTQIDDDGQDRGLLFMAYNASLSEQFEVVQRWLVGGNSTGSSSTQVCPILGLPEAGGTRQFRFEVEDGRQQAHTFRVALDRHDTALDEPLGPTRLEWGLYLFAPSLAVLRRLQAAAAASAAGHASVPWELARGRALLAALPPWQPGPPTQADIDAWKAALEDAQAVDRLDSAALWAAIRADHGGLLRTPYGTLVASRELLHEVLLDGTGRYSVNGQQARMVNCFGPIYLGMDAGPDYEQLAGPVNDAITALGQETGDARTAFRLAFAATQRKLDQIAEGARRSGSEVGDTRFEVTLDAREFVDEVLADLCEAWFGLRGSPHLRRDGQAGDWQPGQPPRYPGLFTALSRYMFQPHPGQRVKVLAKEYGAALRTAFNAFVADHRAAGTAPQWPLPVGGDAPIAKAIFDHPGHGRDNDFVARTMIGVLMGFIPTVIGASFNVLREWADDALLADLRQRLGGSRERRDAYRLLHAPMAAAAKMRPMPPQVWRTVLQPHRLVGSAGAGVDLAAGDLVVLGLVSGTQQALAEGVLDDGRLMFGGTREATPHPTHACPGYNAGIDAVIGTLAGLLAWQGLPGERLRPGPAPLIFSLDGPLAPPVPTPDAALETRATAKADMAAEKLARRAAHVQAPDPPPRSGRLLVWGDSWVGYPGLTDPPEWLARWNYQVQAPLPSLFWLKLQRMASGVQQFVPYLRRALGDPSRLDLLLSGGGNDSTHQALEALLNPRSVGGPALNTVAADAHVALLRGHWETVLSAIEAELLRYGAQGRVRVLLHGYDHPLPDGRGPGWLRAPFAAQGYDVAGDASHRQLAAAAMQDLIDRYNAMLAGLRPGGGALPGQRSFDFVRVVALTGTIASHYTPAVDGWHDNLHPTDEAYRLLALHFDAALQGP